MSDQSSEGDHQQMLNKNIKTPKNQHLPYHTNSRSTNVNNHADDALPQNGETFADFPPVAACRDSLRRPNRPPEELRKASEALGVVACAARAVEASGVWWWCVRGSCRAQREWSVRGARRTRASPTRPPNTPLRSGGALFCLFGFYFCVV